MKKISILLGQQVRKVRKKCGFTIEALAGEANISPVFLSDIERGKKEPSVSTLYKISRGLKINISYLLKPLEKNIKIKFKRETIEIIADEPTRELVMLLEGKNTQQIKTAVRVLKGLFEEERK